MIMDGAIRDPLGEYRTEAHAGISLSGDVAVIMNGFARKLPMGFEQSLY